SIARGALGVGETQSGIHDERGTRPIDVDIAFVGGGGDGAAESLVTRFDGIGVKGALRKSQYPDRGACSGRVLGTAEVHGAHEGIHGTAAEVVCSSSAGACGSGDGAVVTHAPGGHAAGASVGAADVDGGIIGEGGVESHQRVRFWTACRDGVGENCVG